MRRTAGLVSALAFRAAAVLVAQASDSIPLYLTTTWSPPGSQRCFVNEQAPLPLDEVFDSVALDASLAGLTRHSLVISVRLAGPDPRPQRRRSLWTPIGDTIAVVEASPRDAAAVGVADMLQQHLRTPAPRADLLLRIDIDSTRRFRTGHSTFCPPVPRDPSAIRSALNAVAGSGVRQFHATIHVVVRADGSVGELQMEGTTFNPQLDQIIRQAVSATRFYPPLIDRIPMAVALQIPLQLPGR